MTTTVLPSSSQPVLRDNFMIGNETDTVDVDIIEGTNHQDMSAAFVEVAWILLVLVIIVLVIIIWSRNSNCASSPTNQDGSNVSSSEGKSMTDSEAQEERTRHILDSLHVNGQQLEICDGRMLSDADGRYGRVFLMQDSAHSNMNKCQERQSGEKAIEESKTSSQTGNEAPPQDDENTCNNIDIESADWLQLPSNTSIGQSKVPNNCAICLQTYAIGETLVWSANKECHHVYHRDCLVSYLARTEGERTCPTCRRSGYLCEMAKEDDTADAHDGLTESSHDVEMGHGS